MLFYLRAKLEMTEIRILNVKIGEEKIKEVNNNFFCFEDKREEKESNNFLFFFH